MRAGFREDAAVALALNTRIEKHENAAIFERPDKAAKALLQRDDGVGNLIVEEWFYAPRTSMASMRA